MMVQVAPLFRVVPHLPAPPCAAVARENGPVKVIPVMVRADPEALRSVSVCAVLAVAGLVAPTLPKLRLAGVTTTAALEPDRGTATAVALV